MGERDPHGTVEGRSRSATGRASLSRRWSPSLESRLSGRCAGRSVSERPTVLLVDDHAVVRAGIRMLLESQADVTVVAEASSAEDAIASDG